MPVKMGICPKCKGIGKVNVYNDSFTLVIDIEDCPMCKGTGRVD